MEIRKVSIHLRSVIDGDETSCDYIGEYRQIDGGHLIAYTDYTGNAITKVGIEARDNAMLLHRVGSITADMLFEPGTGTVVNYEALSLKSGFILHKEGCSASLFFREIQKKKRFRRNASQK